ncbi:hypothetical protein EDC94DRAFT_690906, partial [Helicostylum pulchrum]
MKEKTIMSQQCEDYRMFFLRTRVSREPFPATEADMLAYIRYRGRNSTCFPYFINLDRHPTHGPKWLERMNSNVKIRNEISALMHLWDIPASKYPSIIGIPGNRPSEPVYNKPTSARAPFPGAKRGFMLSSPLFTPAQGHFTVPTSMFEPESSSGSKKIAKPMITAVTENAIVAEPKSLPVKKSAPVKSAFVTKCAPKPKSTSTSKSVSELEVTKSVSKLIKTPSKTRNKTPSKTASNDRIPNKASKSTRVSRSDLKLKKEPEEATPKPKKDIFLAAAAKASSKRKPSTNLLNETFKKRNVVSEYREPYILIESLDPYQQALKEIKPLVEYDSQESLESRSGSSRLVLYESEEERKDEKKEKKREYEVVKQYSEEECEEYEGVYEGEEEYEQEDIYDEVYEGEEEYEQEDIYDEVYEGEEEYE